MCLAASPGLRGRRSKAEAESPGIRARWPVFQTYGPALHHKEQGSSSVTQRNTSTYLKVCPQKQNSPGKAAGTQSQTVKGYHFPPLEKWGCHRSTRMGMMGPCGGMSLEAATSEIYFANTSRREDVHILCPAQRQAQESVHTICQDTLLVSVRSHRTH